MNYEKAYKGALARANSFETPECRGIAEYIFPELIDEEKMLIETIYNDLHFFYEYKKSKLLSQKDKDDIEKKWLKVKTWLEKQKEQKSIE